ncbi:MAG: hypothetical protein AAF690_27135 [Acidobacteriota bacterium]
MLEDFPLADEERSSIARFTDRAFDLYRVAEEAEADAGWTDADREQLQALVERSDVFLRRLDKWTDLESSSFDLVAGDDLPNDLISALQVNRLRLAEVWLRIQEGDCQGASELLAANSRIAEVLAAEPNFVLHMLSWVPEQAFYEGVQNVLQAHIFGDCRVAADLGEMQNAFAKLGGRQGLFARAFAAEGAFHYSAMSAQPDLHGPGINPCFMTSSWLAFLGESAQLSAMGEVVEAPDRGRLTPTCARLADMIVPNMQGSIDKNLRSRYARALTGRLLHTARCLSDETCALDDLPSFVGPEGERTAIRDVGDRRTVELSPGIEESSMAYRRRTLETILVPAALASAF